MQMNHLILTSSFLLCYVFFNIASADPSVDKDSDPLGVNDGTTPSVSFESPDGYPVPVDVKTFSTEATWLIESKEGVALIDASCYLDLPGEDFTDIPVIAITNKQTGEEYKGPDYAIEATGNLEISTSFEVDEPLDLSNATEGRMMMTFYFQDKSGDNSTYIIDVDVKTK